MSESMINRLTIYGVGLIGGSLARALKQAGAVGEIIGFGRSVGPLKKAVELGVIDRYATDVAAAVTASDVVLLGVPVGAMEAVLGELKPHLNANTIITDVGSTKGSVVAAAEKVFGELPPRFIPGHPIAGTEKSGVEASFAELYQHRRVILTPNERSDREALERVRWMWQQAGARRHQPSAAYACLHPGRHPGAAGGS
jgi:prephenate dehydrogenase